MKGMNAEEVKAFEEAKRTRVWLSCEVCYARFPTQGDLVNHRRDWHA